MLNHQTTSWRVFENPEMYVNCAIQAHATQPVPPALLAVPAACRLDHCIGITQGSGRRGLPHLLHCPRLLVAQFVPWGALCRISRRVAGQIGFVAPVFMFACTIAYIWRCSYRCAWQRNRLSRTPFNNDGKMNRPTIPTINFFCGTWQDGPILEQLSCLAMGRHLASVAVDTSGQGCLSALSTIVISSWRECTLHLAYM